MQCGFNFLISTLLIHFFEILLLVKRKKTFLVKVPALFIVQNNLFCCKKKNLCPKWKIQPTLSLIYPPSSPDNSIGVLTSTKPN